MAEVMEEQTPELKKAEPLEVMVVGRHEKTREHV